MIRRLYPGGKKKAFNITYDDGVIQDIRFVLLMNKYGLKGTFNLNSQLMERELEWEHESGLRIKRLSKEAARWLYEGHEVASHSLTHPDMRWLSEEQIMYELGHDKWLLSQYFRREIGGFALPFDYYSDTVAACAERLGFEYSRCSEETYSYAPPEDYYHWAAGTYHVQPGFLPFVEGFFDTEEELALCQIVGHSYDLDTMDMWELMESILRRVAEDGDIASMTNLELVRYLRAMRAAKISKEHICNTSGQTLWFEAEGEIIALAPGEEIRTAKA